MEDLETLNGSLSFESADLPHSKASPLKAALASLPRLPPSHLGQCRSSNLRRDYKQMKTNYLKSEHKKQALQEGLATLKAAPCTACPALAQDSASTKLALEEALGLTKLLLQEVSKYA